MIVSKSGGRSGIGHEDREAIDGCTDLIDLSFHDTLPTAALVCDRLLRDYEAFRVLKSCGDEECTFSAGSRWLMAASRQYLIFAVRPLWDSWNARQLSVNLKFPLVRCGSKADLTAPKSDFR